MFDDFDGPDLYEDDLEEFERNQVAQDREELDWEDDSEGEDQ